MRLVRKHTDIPVPEVLAAYQDESTGHVCIVMEFIEGDTLENVWDSFSPSQKGEIIEQLQSYFSQLRGIKGDFIGSVDRTACEDPLFDNELGAYGPFRDENEFNGGIVKALKRAESSSFVDMIGLMIHSVMKNHDIVLTHGDFAPRNILVRGTTVVAVLEGIVGLLP
jgi:aminoglycoside phosphotransferase (APT) family kinase protein